eukprot:TRINITY_DN4182_c1_g1_i7.p1 TRINITY_DN4182_c1_g1~~TRINITY_DN4182_c1_g1_i7.p1  ORF type:complete len:218 (+),score=9.75 TRINITY_DN4182_c1_g1_i7:60-713(+)
MTFLKLTSSNLSKKVRIEDKDGLKSKPQTKQGNQLRRNFKFNNNFKHRLKQNNLSINRIKTNAQSSSSSSFFNSEFEEFDYICSTDDLDPNETSENTKQIFNFAENNVKNEKQANVTTKNQKGNLANIVRILLLFVTVTSSAWMSNKIIRPVFQLNATNSNNNNNNINEKIKLVEVVVIVPKGGVSELGVPWSEVMEHTAQRMKWHSRQRISRFLHR